MPYKFATVEGIPIHLLYRGRTTLPELPPDTSRGLPILGLHGRAGTAADLGTVLDDLARDHSPMAFDQPGHGRSGGTESLGSVEALADLTLALVDKLGLPRVVLLGEDLGGAVALAAAARRPGAVAALVLLSTPDRFAIPDEAFAQLERVVRGRERRRFDPSGFGPDTPREVFGRAFASFMQVDPRVQLGDLRAGAGFDASELDLAGVPVVVLAGGAEPEPARERVRALAARLPAELREVPKAGRHLLLEAPAAVAEAARELLHGVAP